MVGRRGPRLPLAIAGRRLADRLRHADRRRRSTPLARLMAAYVVFGVGFGFVNAPITNAAVSGMPRAQAGVAAAIATDLAPGRPDARRRGRRGDHRLQLGASGHADPSTASRPAWWTLTACCGVVLALGACGHRQAGQRVGPPHGCCAQPRGASGLGARRMSTQPAENPDPPSSTASEVWLLMSDLVLDNTRRREVVRRAGHELRPRPRRPPPRTPPDVDGRARRRAGHRPPQRDRARGRPRVPGPRPTPAPPHRRARQGRRGHARGQAIWPAGPTRSSRRRPPC